MIENVNVRRNWEECPRDPAKSRWTTLYATLNPLGELSLSKFTHEQLGAPSGYVLLFDRDREVIGMRPANPTVERNAYPVAARGRHGGQRVYAHRMCREFGVQIKETVRFHHCQIDHNGILILDMKDTIPARGPSKRNRW
ncbi:MAG TPA: hypothetical protein PLL77_08825 [Pyrinomonadaceae bacterium]|nr:hypothetical protein [Pyrinomonadaceae bacterium]